MQHPRSSLVGRATHILSIPAADVVPALLVGVVSTGALSEVDIEDPFVELRIVVALPVRCRSAVKSVHGVRTDWGNVDTFADESHSVAIKTTLSPVSSLPVVSGQISKEKKTLG